jgi:hypothetical protein
MSYPPENTGGSSGPVIVPPYSTFLPDMDLGKSGIEGWMPRLGVFDLTAPGTFQATIALPAGIIGCRLLFENNNTIASPVVNSCSVSNPLTVADVNNSAGTWVQGTKQQATVFPWQCPKPNGGTQLVVPTYTDFIPITTLPPTDGSLFHLLTMRVTMAAFSVATFGGLPVGGDATTTGSPTGDNYTNWATRPDGRIRIWRYQTGSFSAAGTQSGFTSTTNISQCPIRGVILYFRNRVAQHWSFGDSNGMAAGATYRDDNAAMRLAFEMNDPNGIVHCHYPSSWSGMGGNPYNGFYRRTRDLLRRNDLNGNFLWFPTATPNDALGAITAAINQSSDQNVAKCCDMANKRGMRNILTNFAPVGKNTRNWSTDITTPASDTLRVAKNLADAAMNSEGTLVIDVDSMVTKVAPYNGQIQPLSNTGDQSLMGFVFDEIHYSDAIFNAMKDAAKPFVKKSLGT